MAELAMIATVVSAVATGAGALVQAQGQRVQAKGTLAAGKAAQENANFEAAQLEIAGKEERAAAQRDMLEIRRRKELALSTGQNNAAASGFSATDPTALALQDEIARYGEIQEQLAAYGGESRQAGINAQATGRRLEGVAARQGAAYGAAGYRASAAGTILGGISSMASRFSPPSSSQSSSYRYG